MSTLNIVQLQTALGIPVTATFVLEVLKVPAAGNEKRAVWWEAGQYEAIVDALIAHIEKARKVNVAAIDGKRSKKVKEEAAAPAAAIAKCADTSDLFGDAEPETNDDLFN
ncbi:MAG: hypothetical protein ACK5OQ_16425 [Burkholderiales bacterium]|jgi:uncharacterized membrane protein YqiK